MDPAFCLGGVSIYCASTLYKTREGEGASLSWGLPHYQFSLLASNLAL